MWKYFSWNGLIVSALCVCVCVRVLCFPRFMTTRVQMCPLTISYSREPSVPYTVQDKMTLIQRFKCLPLTFHAWEGEDERRRWECVNKWKLGVSLLTVCLTHPLHVPFCLLYLALWFLCKYSIKFLQKLIVVIRIHSPVTSLWFIVFSFSTCNAVCEHRAAGSRLLRRHHQSDRAEWAGSCNVCVGVCFSLWRSVCNVTYLFL